MDFCVFIVVSYIHLLLILRYNSIVSLYCTKTLYSSIAARVSIT